MLPRDEAGITSVPAAAPSFESISTVTILVTVCARPLRVFSFFSLFESACSFFYSILIHGHSYIGFIFSFASSIHNKQTIVPTFCFRAFALLFMINNFEIYLEPSLYRFIINIFESYLEDSLYRFIINDFENYEDFYTARFVFSVFYTTTTFHSF